MYREGTEQHEHHRSVYGGPEKFGYKDFISHFRAELFDADEWAEIVADSGARFAGPVGEHHDGFSMWNSPSNEWCAAKMGPKRDIVGELEKAYRAQGLRYMVAMHHAENWWFFPHWRPEFDTSDPRYAGLYGESHNLEGPIGKEWFFDQSLPSRAFLKQWRTRLDEVVSCYSPDMIWFDFGICRIDERTLAEFVADYYNGGADRLITYKDDHLPPNIAVLDFELGRESKMTNYEWLTDSTVDDGCAWGFMNNAAYKGSAELVHYLIDNVSKNGYLLLNVGPKADGTFPDEAKSIMRDMGNWLKVNGEAIYGTTPWFVSGEGSTQLQKGGAFNEGDKPNYTAEDIRFTAKGDSVYAIVLGRPTGEVKITSFSNERIYPGSVKSVCLLGSDEPISFKQNPDGLVIQPFKSKPCEFACAFKIERCRAYEG